MSLTESQAQQITLIRILEQSRDNGGLWSAADAKAATQASAELVGAQAPFDQFVARRAQWALEEIGKRAADAGIDLRTPRWPTVVAWVTVAAALLAGFVIDHLASDRRVNIVEFPLVGLIVWNLAIFIAIFLRSVSIWVTRRSGAAGLLTESVGKWRLKGAFSARRGRAKRWIEAFEAEWAALSAPLNQARLTFVFHSAALLFAMGALGSLYVRGFFREYRAGWESTFFSADSIHAIASVVLAPGAMLLNRDIPDSGHIAGLRFPASPGEIANDWIHLYAASILAWIIVPRLVLALANLFSMWRQRRAFPLPRNSSYFATLRTIRRGGSAVVLALPFRYELTNQISANLSNLLGRVHGLAVDISITPPILMGEDTHDWKSALGRKDYIAVLVIFDLAATAEPDAHGQVIKRIVDAVGGRTAVLAIVDSGSYSDRDAERFRERCGQWRTVLDATGCAPLFMNLMQPDDEALTALAALAARLNQHG